MCIHENTNSFIRGIAPQKEHEIAIKIFAGDFTEAREFKEEYLSAHPMYEEYSENELDLLSAAFLKVAGNLPIFSDDLIRWIHDTGVFDDGAAVQENAENVLGMEPVEATVNRSPGRRWSPITASPEDTAKIAYASYSDRDALTVADEIIALVYSQGGRGENLPLKTA